MSIPILLHRLCRARAPQPHVLVAAALIARLRAARAAPAVAKRPRR